MRKATCGILFGLLIMAAFSVHAGEKPAKVDDASIQQYYAAVGKFYNVPERAVATIKRKGSPTKSWRWSFSSRIVPGSSLRR